MNTIISVCKSKWQTFGIHEIIDDLSKFGIVSGAPHLMNESFLELNKESDEVYVLNFILRWAIELLLSSWKHSVLIWIWKFKVPLQLSHIYKLLALTRQHKPVLIIIRKIYQQMTVWLGHSSYKADCIPFSHLCSEGFHYKAKQRNFSNIYCLDTRSQANQTAGKHNHDIITINQYTVVLLWRLQFPRLSV